MLLVLDNLEHVMDAASLVADLLTSIAPLKVLATSRSPLRCALTRLIECGRPAEASDIAWGLMFFWLIRGTRPKVSDGTNRF